MKKNTNLSLWHPDEGVEDENSMEKDFIECTEQGFVF